MKVTPCTHAAFLVYFLTHGFAFAGTAFTYQGAMHDAGVPANGIYDTEFVLFDAESGGNQVSSVVGRSAIDVIDGIFTVAVDFGASAFDGTDLWLEIRAGPTGGSLATLTPRQAITPTPLAINADKLDGLDSTDFLTVETDGDPSNELQNVFVTIVADTGTTTADSQTDTLSVVGFGTVGTIIVGDTLTISDTSSLDNLGSHVASQDLDLGNNNLVGSGGTVGLSIANDGSATIGSALTLDGLTDVISTSTGTLGFGDDDLITTGALTASTLTISGLDCTGDANGGALTTDASGVISCSDDDTSANTLDEAYDQGGAGIGRLITADSGAVVISGTAGLELDSGSLTITPGDPRSIATSNTLGGNPVAIAVSGNYAYIIDDGADDLRIVDVTNPGSPTRVSTLSLPTSPQAIDVAGRYAYIVAEGSDDLKVVDVSNPGDPSVVGSLAIFFEPNGVVVSGSYAYVSDRTQNSLFVVDITDPTQPSLMGQLDLVSPQFMDVFVQGRYAYLIDFFPQELTIVDVANPAAPTKVGSVPVGDGPISLYVNGRYAYVLDRSDQELFVVEVSDPTSPTIVSSIGVGLRPNDLVVSGRYAFVADESTADLKVIDVSDPANPALVGSLGAAIAIEALAVAGQYLYLVEEVRSEIEVRDISGLESASLVAHSLEAGNLQVRDDVITQGNVAVAGGVSIGAGGLYSDGDVGVSGTIALANDVAPAASPANVVQVYAEDVAGSSELRVRDEAGNITTLSPHNFSLIGERSEPMAWSFYSENEHGKINVDMLRAMRLIEHMSGESLVRIAPSGAKFGTSASIASRVSVSDRTTMMKQQSNELLRRNKELERTLRELEVMAFEKKADAAKPGGAQ